MKKSKALFAAAVAGIFGAAGMAAPAPAFAGKKDKKMEDGAHKCGGMKSGGADTVNCYGVNKCKGAGKCGGEGSSCAGTNSCKGQGWLPMPKDSCLSIEGGSTEPIKKG